MNLTFEIDQQPPTPREIEAERDRLRAKLKRQKIFAVAVAGAIIVTLIALYWGGFISWRALIATVGGIALIGVSVVALAGASVGASISALAVALAGAVVGVLAGVGALAIVFVSVITLAGVDALTDAVVGTIAGVSILAVSIIGAIIIVTVVSIEDNREALVLLDDIDLEHYDEAVDLSNKYPLINEYCNKVVDQGRKLTKEEFKAMEAWATQLDAERMA